MIERQNSRREPGEAQIAVLIDYENVGLGSIQSLLDQISDIGRIIVKRAYADWTSQSDKRDQLLEFGVELIHLFRSTSSGKNASDIRLVIDAVDLLYSSPVDTFVIVSSDSDFVPLTSKLRSAGKTVIGAGRSAVVSRTLITACDRYIYLDTPKPSTETKQPTIRKQTEALLVRAVNNSVDREGQVRGAKLHQTMIRLDPSFDFRTLEYKTFTQFLESSDKVHVIRETAQDDVTVELVSAQGDKITNSKGITMSQEWDDKIDEAWSKRPGSFLPGPWAAARAARVLGVSKLSVSPYKTLQELLDASDHLRSRWTRNGNTIARR